MKQIDREGKKVFKYFTSQKNTPLNIPLPKNHNPLTLLYRRLQGLSGEILAKNQALQQSTALSKEDIELIQSGLAGEVAIQSKRLERHLFLLPTVVSLAPFLGLLGTVWGILLTLSELETDAANLSMGGLSMALATTVLGLLVAIPPLIGYNYLKAKLRDFFVDMYTFSQQTLAAVELQYRV